MRCDAVVSLPRALAGAIGLCFDCSVLKTRYWLGIGADLLQQEIASSHKTAGQEMPNILDDAKRDAAECRRSAAAETDANVAGQLLAIADAWDNVIRAHDEDVRRLAREKLLRVAAGSDRLAEQARWKSGQT